MTGYAIAPARSMYRSGKQKGYPEIFSYLCRKVQIFNFVEREKIEITLKIIESSHSRRVGEDLRVLWVISPIKL